MTDQLIPRLPRRMKQPPKAALRQLLAESASTIEKLTAELQWARRPWWYRAIYSRNSHLPPHRNPTAPPTKEGKP